MYNKSKSKNLDVKHIAHIMRSTNKLSKKGVKILSLCTSQSVNNSKNALYKHFKLSQHRDKIFTPFLDNLFVDRMI